MRAICVVNMAVLDWRSSLSDVKETVHDKTPCYH